MNRVLSWFSCGAASAIATKLAIAQYGDRVQVVRCYVAEEHPDNERFAAECQKWFGVPVTVLHQETYKSSAYEVVRRRGYWSGTEGAPCTRILKKNVRQGFQQPTDLHIFGYTADAKDLDRWDKFLDANNDISAAAPLIDRGLQHKDCLAMLQDAGIGLPVMYLQGFHHNNCIGCVKAGGMGYWNKIRVHYPAQFKEACELSRSVGARALMDNGVHKFLDELVPGTGDYESEPEIQCGVFCEAGKEEYRDA